MGFNSGFKGLIQTSHGSGIEWRVFAGTRLIMLGLYRQRYMDNIILVLIVPERTVGINKGDSGNLIGLLTTKRSLFGAVDGFPNRNCRHLSLGRSWQFLGEQC